MLLARPVSVESDSSESEECDVDRVQPGESIIDFEKYRRAFDPTHSLLLA